MATNPMRYMICVKVPEAKAFFDQARGQKGCCGCGADIPIKADWSAIAHVQRSANIVGGILCKNCHRSFGRWMTSRRRAGRRKEKSSASRGASPAAEATEPPKK